MWIGLALCCAGAPAAAVPPEGPADDVIELAPTTIKGNTELPKYLYVVPWQDKQSKNLSERSLRLHNLYGDLFDPLMPAPVHDDALTHQIARPPAPLD